MSDTYQVVSRYSNGKYYRETTATFPNLESVLAYKPKNVIYEINGERLDLLRGTLIRIISPSQPENTARQGQQLKLF